MFDNLIIVFLVIAGLCVVVSFGIKEYFKEKRRNLQALMNPNSKENKGE